MNNIRIIPVAVALCYPYSYMAKPAIRPIRYFKLPKGLLTMSNRLYFAALKKLPDEYIDESTVCAVVGDTVTAQAKDLPTIFYRDGMNKWEEMDDVRAKPRGAGNSERGWSNIQSMFAVMAVGAALFAAVIATAPNDSPKMAINHCAKQEHLKICSEMAKSDSQLAVCGIESDKAATVPIDTIPEACREAD